MMQGLFHYLAERWSGGGTAGVTVDRAIDHHGNYQLRIAHGCHTDEAGDVVFAVSAT